MVNLLSVGASMVEEGVAPRRVVRAAGCSLVFFRLRVVGEVVVENSVEFLIRVARHSKLEEVAQLLESFDGVALKL